MSFLRRPQALRVSTLGFGVLLLALPLAAQQPFVPAPHVPVSPPLPRAKMPAERPGTPRSLVGGPLDDRS